MAKFQSLCFFVTFCLRVSSCGPTNIFFNEIHFPRWRAKWRVGSRCDISRWQHCRTHKRLERASTTSRVPNPRTFWKHEFFSQGFLGWSFLVSGCDHVNWLSTLHTIWCRGAAERCFAKEILQCQLRTPIPAEDLGGVHEGFFYLEEKKSRLINSTRLLKIYEI